MSFSQGSFLMLFLPITILVYYIISNKNSKGKLFRNTWLLLVSIFFYAWGEPLFVLVMLGSIVINWALCLVMKKAVGVWQKGVFSFLLLWDVGILFIFKYLSFCLKNLSYFWNVHVFELALPIGISFFSFQLLSYVIDVYRGEEPQKNIINLALYLIMFPQLVWDIALVLRLKKISIILTWLKQ